MRHFSIVLLVAWMVATSTSSDDPQAQSKSEDHAIGLLRDAEPIIHRDESLPGRPVVAVRFRPNVGTVEDVHVGPGAPLLTVRGAAGEALVPFVDAICREVDLPARRIVIDPPEGLLGDGR